jgi:hypothetical protein
VSEPLEQDSSLIPKINMSRNLTLPDRAEIFPYARNEVDREIDDQIERIVGCLSDPLIVYPGWEDALPGKLKREIPVERIVRVYKMEGDEQCGDLEAMAYLYTASLSVSLSERWGNIYINLAKQYMKNIGFQLDNISTRDLVDEEYAMLRELKTWIRSQQKGSRKRENGNLKKGS